MLVKEFYKDPISFLPANLANEFREALKKKVKSINKRVRNYDGEYARRKKGRRARAVTSLTTVLAELDPEFRELIVRAIRHNVTTKGKYGDKDHTVMRLLNALNAVCSVNNLENWQDEEVIPEAEQLASIHWIMNQ